MDGKSDQERRAALVTERHWATLRQLAESQAIRAIGDSVCELLAGRREVTATDIIEHLEAQAAGRPERDMLRMRAEKAVELLRNLTG